ALLQVYKLTALVSDLLDVSKIESGQLSMSFQEFNIVELLNDVIDVMHYGNLNHKIIKNCSASEIIVYADKQRIEQVMINLVSNAIKYSPDGDRVIVSVHDHEGSVLVSIQDFGIGINAEDQPQIFSRFYRVEELASFIAGLGIGLYISQDIMERHGSVITVDSHYGVGSTFSFKLPAQRGLS
ncbi:HAMP domain-containing sensor histidine kinase, partial [Daejeonella sp.]|uniref:sensor histidine kinase n=1 Tax=Daejeonella sp. TaxID=2805397 RepID=UPI0030BACE1B